ELVLDRILDREDVPLAVRQAAERRVERRCLAAAGRTADEEEPVALAEDPVHRRRERGCEPEALELERRRRAIEEAQHRALAERRRQDGYADVEDRKSTRLNSSHVSISYAVFCLKKK